MTDGGQMNGAARRSGGRLGILALKLLAHVGQLAAQGEDVLLLTGNLFVRLGQELLGGGQLISQRGHFLLFSPEAGKGVILWYRVWPVWQTPQFLNDPFSKDLCLG